MRLACPNVLTLAALTLFCSTSFATSLDKQKVVEVPFSYEHGQIYVPVEVGGRDAVFPMLLMTSIKRSVVSQTVATAAGFEITLSNPNAADYDINYSRHAMARRLKIGDLEIGGLDVGIGPNGGAAGMLGNDFLKHYVTQIDFPRRVIRFYQTSPFPKGATIIDGARSVVPMKLDSRDGGPILETVLVNGRTIKVSGHWIYRNTCSNTCGRETHWTEQPWQGGIEVRGTED